MANGRLLVLVRPGIDQELIGSTVLNWPVFIWDSTGRFS
jgi:hypothetical protein